jgi:small subunit ribosomal protein S6
VREFDTTVIVQPEISEEGRETLIERLKGLLERAGAVPFEVDDMGKRKLAYEIRRFQKGHYLSFFYGDTGKAVSELERALRIDESILRFLTIRRADEVGDLEARKARAVELEKLRHEKAAERAAREAEERAAREAARLAGEPVEESGEDEEEYAAREAGGDEEEGDERTLPGGE